MSRFPGAVINVDWEGIEYLIVRRAAEGLKKTGGLALAHAKHHAPVRKIFDVNKGGGGRRGPRADLPAGFMRGMNRGDEDMFYNAFLAAKPRNRRIDVSNRSWAPDGPYYGHPNSMVPLFRFRENGAVVRQAGQFRRWDSASRTLTTRGHEAFQQIRGSSRGPTSNVVDPNDFLTRRGRYEVQSGRARFTPVVKTELRFRGGRVEPVYVAAVIPANLEKNRPARNIYINPKTGAARGLPSQIGGRLRESIYLGNVYRQGMRLIIRVTSPTEYSIHVEYGTAKHGRAQPFMRPALYEVRDRFLTDVRQAVTSRAGIAALSQVRGSALTGGDLR